MALAERLLVEVEITHRARLFPRLPAHDRAAHDAPGFIPTDPRNRAGSF
jgi:hypothetical protein